MAGETVTPWRIPFTRDARRFAWQSSSPGEHKRVIGSDSVFTASISRFGKDLRREDPSTSNAERGLDSCVKYCNELEVEAANDFDSSANEIFSDDAARSGEDPLVTFLESRSMTGRKNCERVGASRGEDSEQSQLSNRTMDVTIDSVCSVSPCETSSPRVNVVCASRTQLACDFEQIRQIVREGGKTEDKLKLRIAHQAVRLLSDALSAAMRGETEELGLIFPENSTGQTCDCILAFFNRQLTNPRNSAFGETGGASRASHQEGAASITLPSCPTVVSATPASSYSSDSGTSPDMPKRKSTKQPPAKTSSVSREGPEDQRAAELRDSIQKKEEELAKLAQYVISVAADPVKKATAKMEIKRVERLLMNDSLALAVLDSSGKFSNAMTNRIENIESRQDACEEDVKLNKTEIGAMQKRLALLEEENRNAKAERREILKLVDAIDNNSRKQSLVLHGLRPDEDARALFPNHARHIDRVYQVGQPTTSARGNRCTIIVHFDTVSRCDSAFDFLNSRNFDQHRSRVGYARNTSMLSRIGGSRLRMLSDRFVARFPGAVAKKGYISYKDERYSAFDFAMQQITVDGALIDIDSWVRDCEEYEENKGVSAKADGRTVSGVRLRREASSNKRRRSPTPPERRAGRQLGAAVDVGNAARDRPSGQQGSSRPPSTTSTRDTRARQNQRQSAHLPPYDGLTRGNVQVFLNGGNSNHGGNGVRNKVPNVSRGHDHGYPPRTFINRRYQSQRTSAS